MKRPLSVIGFTMLISLVVLCFANSIVFTVCVCGLFAFSALILIVKRKPRQSSVLMTLCLSVAFSCLIFTAFQYYTYLPALKLIDNKTQITAEISDFPIKSSGRYHVTAKIKLKDSGRKVNIRLSFPVSSKYDDELEDVIESLEVGDKVSFTGNIYKLGASNEDAEQSFKSRKIFLGAYPLGKVTAQKASYKTLRFFILKERKKTINLLLNSFSNETSAVAVSILFGYKTHLQSDTYKAFQNAGIAHIMAVSGLHLSIWVAFLMNFAVFFGLDRRKVSYFLIAFVFLVMAFAGFSGSATRAGIMMVMYLLGFITRRNADSLNSLGLASFIFLLNNPYACLNISFVLSFLSTFAIITVSSYYMKRADEALEKKVKQKYASKILSAFLASVIISLTVSIFTIPVLALYFGQISLMGVISNLLIFPVITPLIISLGLFVMFAHIPVISAVLMKLSKLLITYCISVCETLGSFKHSTIRFERETALIFAVVCIVSCFAVLIAVKQKSKAIRLLSILLSVLLVTSSLLYNTYYKLNKVIIGVYNVSDGLCVSVETDDKKLLLFSQCDEYHSRFISDKVGTAEAVILTDAENGNMKLISELSPKSVFLSAGEEMLPVSLRNKILKSDLLTFGKTKILIKQDVIYLDVYGIMIAVTDNFADNADIIITNNNNVLDCVSNSVIILSSELFSEKAITTAKHSDVTVIVSGGAKYKIRGENSWQYLMKKG